MTKNQQERRAEAVDAVALLMVRIMDQHALAVVDEALREISKESIHEVV
jgi:hypothetical protein